MSSKVDLWNALTPHGDLETPGELERQLRSPGLSSFLREFLQIVDCTSLFHDQVDAQSILLWNLGPHGFEKSGLHIDHLFAENRSVICLQDLRIPLHKKEDIRHDLERRFPYKVFICVYQHRPTSRHRNHGYVFSTLTALHTGVFLSAFSFQIGAPVYRSRRDRRRTVFTDGGRSLCITATRRSGEKIHILNIYQFTATHSSMQSKLWERLTNWIRKHLEEKIILLGDMNCTMPEVLVTQEIVWKDIGRHRPRGRTSYSNDALRKLLLPDGLFWLVTQRRPTRHDSIPLDPSLAELTSRKYGQYERASPWYSRMRNGAKGVSLPCALRIPWFWVSSC
jgi:hypothetical protein